MRNLVVLCCDAWAARTSVAWVRRCVAARLKMA